MTGQLVPSGSEWVLMESAGLSFRWWLLWQERGILLPGMAAVFPALYGAGLSGAEFWSGAFFFAAMLSISVLDCRYGMIFDKVLLPLGISGLGLHCAGVLGDAGDALLGAALGFLLLLLVRMGSRGGMGGGDVKYAAVLGAWLGWQQVLLALFLAFLTGGMAGIGIVCHGGRDRMPFGPFLSIGAGAAFLWGASFLQWYEGYWL